MSVLLSACVGGGGGGSGSGGSGSDVASRLEVVITYPSPANDLQASTSQVFVFGRLMDVEDGVVDADEIDYLEVNGTLITLDPDDPSVWSALVDAPEGGSTLTVTVGSSGGGVHTVSQELRNQFEFDDPGPIALDTADNRAFVLDTGLNAIVEVDLSTGVRNLFSSASGATTIGGGPSLTTGSGIDFDADNNRLLVAASGVYDEDRVVNVNGHFLAVDLATANRSYLSSPSNQIGDGSAGTDVAMDVIADPHNGRALGIAFDGTTLNFSSCPGGVCLLTSSRDVLAIDESSGDRSIFAGSIKSYAMKLAIDYAHDRLFVLNGPITRELNVIGLGTGSETLLSGANQPDANNRFGTPTALAINADGSKAYVTDLLAIPLFEGTNRSGIIEVDGLTGERTILSSVEDGTGIDMVEPTGIAVDDSANRAIVTDKELAAVLNVSLDTGDRSVLSGSVPEIDYPTAVLADPANQRVFVGTGARQGTIFVVDLQSGALEVVFDTTNGTQEIVDRVEGMALDVERNRLYFVDTSALQYVDLVTGDHTLVSGFDYVAGLDVGSGPDVDGTRALALDLANNRAYLLSEFNQHVVGVNLTTGDRTSVSDNSGAGSGQAFLDPHDMAVDLINQKGYVGNRGDADTGGGFIQEVDLVTGDRTVIANNTGTGVGLGSISFGTGQSLAYDTAKQRLIYFAGSPVAIDIATGDRESIINSSGLSPSELGPPLAGGVEDISLDPVNGLAYVAERNYSGVFEVELTMAARGVVAQ